MIKLVISSLLLLIQQSAFSQLMYLESSKISFSAKPVSSDSIKVDSFKLFLRNGGEVPLLFESSKEKPFFLIVLSPDSQIQISTHPVITPSQYDDRGFIKNQKVEIFRLAPGDSIEFNVPLVKPFYYQNTHIELSKYYRYKKEINISFISYDDKSWSSKIGIMNLESFRNKMERVRFLSQ